MKRAALILGLLLTLGKVSANGQEELPDLIDRVKSSVVLLTGYNQNGQPVSRGSGFFVSPQLIVSNWHVIEDSSSLKVVTAEGQSYRVQPIVSDRVGDLVLLQVD